MCIEDAIMGMCPPPDESGKIKVVVEVNMPQPPNQGTSIVDRNHSYSNGQPCMIPKDFIDLISSMMSCDKSPCEKPPTNDGEKSKDGDKDESWPNPKGIR